MTLPKEIDANRMVELAADHVDWFSDMLKPLLRSWMEHGYKHGWDDRPESNREVFAVVSGLSGTTLAICSTKEKAKAAASEWKNSSISIFTWELDGHCLEKAGE